MALVGVVELVEGLQAHITLAQQGLAREEFAEGAIMQPSDVNGLLTQRCMVPLGQVTEFCELVQSSLATIKRTAEGV